MTKERCSGAWKKVFDLDVIIPTRKKQTNNLLCQVHTVLNSGFNVRVTIGIPDSEYHEFFENLTNREKECIRLMKNVAQGSPSIAFIYMLENMDWVDWIFPTADDDCILPWGLKHLLEVHNDMGMVMGQSLGVSREKHLDFSSWKIGHSITECHCSTAIYNMRKMETLSKPWFENSPVSDFLLIKRMSENFPYKIIPSVVHVQAFAELENLGSIFTENFNKLYGHLI